MPKIGWQADFRHLSFDVQLAYLGLLRWCIFIFKTVKRLS